MRVCVIGRGKVGRSLYKALSSTTIAAELVRGHRFKAPAQRADVFVLAVPDGSIHSTAESLAPYVDRRTVVLHCAGAREPGELEACRARGASIAGFHPLVSFASAKAAPDLHGVTFVVHGDAKAARTAKRITKALGAQLSVRPVLGPAYHAAAATVANGSAALASIGVSILRELGFGQREAERALSGMLHTVAANVHSVGVPRALTGPVVRGDAATVRAHLEALRALDPELAEAYRHIQPVILACARASGLDAQSAQAIERELAPSKTGRRRAQPSK